MNQEFRDIIDKIVFEDIEALLDVTGPPNKYLLISNMITKIRNRAKKNLFLNLKISEISILQISITYFGMPGKDVLSYNLKNILRIKKLKEVLKW